MELYNVGVDELNEYDLKDMNGSNFKWIVYWYENGGYDGSGEAVGLHEDGMIYVKGLGHCSCYGPMDMGMESGQTMTVEKFLVDKDDIISYDSRKEIKDKVRELIG